MWFMVALAVINSLNSSRQQNKAARDAQAASFAQYELMKQQRKAEQQDIQDKARNELTVEGRKRVGERGNIKAQMADTGTSGVSSLRALANSYMQESFTKGSIVSSQETALYKSSQGGVQDYTQTQSAVNQAQSKVKSGTEMIFEAAMSGLTTYYTGGLGAKVPSSNTKVPNNTSSSGSYSSYNNDWIA
jgi:type IV secretory pathway TrbL component